MPTTAELIDKDISNYYALISAVESVKTERPNPTFFAQHTIRMIRDKVNALSDTRARMKGDS
jgi:hypothetical protein